VFGDFEVSRYGYCRTSENTPRGVPVLAMAVFLSVIEIDFVRSRHLVFN
jgi:hypothetical protein